MGLYLSSLLTSAGLSIEEQLYNAAQQDNSTEVERLIQGGADLEAKGPDGGRPLHTASFHGNDDCVDLLITYGAHVNAKKPDGQTALMEAALRGELDCLRLLLNNGANVNATRTEGGTALMLAALGDHLECLDLLLSRGANLDAVRSDGNTAWTLAATWGCLACLESLAHHGAYLDPEKVKHVLQSADENGKTDIADFLRIYTDDDDIYTLGGLGGAELAEQQGGVAPETQAATTMPFHSSIFDDRAVVTRPFTRDELETMTEHELRVVKRRLGMGSFGPIPRDEFIDIALAIQESLYEQAPPPAFTEAPATAPPPPPPSSRELHRVTSSSSRNPRTGQMECGICLSGMGGGEGNPMATPPCGHVFCYECLVRIVEETRAAGRSDGHCPTCRQSYSERQVIKLFLP